MRKSIKTIDRLEHALKYCRKNRRVRGAAFIYVITCGEFTKIGIADDPERRLAELQVGNPNELKLVAAFWSEHAFDEEQRIHSDILVKYRVRGEWFKLPHGLVDRLIHGK